ncbi:glycosyltransferase family 2 protein [Fibrobacter sp. UBA4297]|uniref:glycosyltransferase family 2 protein n=1 Tax=Fibrobacter sp. UBA4297 TaxID=1946536 RepID=UPI0025BFF460|nr:glycosyltransferase family 2 protein [Fibrobacter sp. UBA4297]
MNHFLFSICVPVYNVEKYVSECIESVLKQTYKFFELILVDDGSRDDSLKICKEYEKKDNRIRVFSKKNEGQIATRNFAFSKASGNIILCLDSDDFWEPETLDKLNQYFMKYNCDCIYYNWKRFFKGESYLDKKINDKIELIKDKRLLFKKILGDTYYNSMCLKAFKKNCIPSNNDKVFEIIRHAEDLVQTVEIMDKSDCVLFVPDIFYNYRVNMNSISHNASSRFYVPGNPVRFFAYNFLKEKNLYSQEDWDDYGKFCASIFYSNLLKISRLKTSIKEKISILEIERDSEYYNQFLKSYKTGNGLKNLSLALFKKKKFIMLYFFLAMIKMLNCSSFFLRKLIKSTFYLTFNKKI